MMDFILEQDLCWECGCLLDSFYGQCPNGCEEVDYDDEDDYPQGHDYEDERDG